MKKKETKKQEVSVEEENPAKEEETASEGNALPVEEEILEESSNLVSELEQQKEKFIRLLAEFDNYKRRTARERLDIIQTAGKDIMTDLLPVLDDMERAESVLENASDITAVKEGLKLITDKLRGLVNNKGLKAMNPKGEVFDAESMEAITEIDAGPDMKGKVVDVVEKGYALNEKIIRYAKVVVGK